MDGRTGTAPAGAAPGLAGTDGGGPGGLRPGSGGARPAPVRGAGGGGGRLPGKGAWPLFSGLGPVAALRTAPGLARAFTAMVLSGWGMASMTETAALIVSEFASNVVRAAEGPGGSSVYDEEGRMPVLWLRLMADSSVLGIEVWDSLPPQSGIPVLRDADRLRSPAAASPSSTRSASTGAGSPSRPDASNELGQSSPSHDEHAGEIDEATTLREKGELAWRTHSRRGADC